MAAMKHLCLTAFVLLVTIGLTSGDCASKITQCYITFMQNGVTHASNQDIMCNDMQDLVGCLFKQNCDFTAEMEKQLTDHMHSQMKKHGHKCSFTVTHLIKKHKNGATSISTLPSALILLALVTVSILVKIF
ncbi:uncharacterized protein LOC131946625 [Physella acuta]|uniref:uncharacterized protein LOC131946625 n=1 Tax=Physella acuta TaxID=109671 RepID=UPI0027DBA23E|nr:uncharacterized protein LOC131946625 [Physella acuta]XP_059163632.1 uncharacterized protein LOC131946625 [Physella acuta]